MPLPRSKTSRSKRDKRRTHQKLSLLNVSLCPQCGEAKLPHHACPHCGNYKGREILKIEEKT